VFTFRTLKRLNTGQDEQDQATIPDATCLNTASANANPETFPSNADHEIVLSASDQDAQTVAQAAAAVYPGSVSAYLWRNDDFTDVKGAVVVCEVRLPTDRQVPERS
jgi:hypothetical protein